MFKEITFIKYEWSSDKNKHLYFQHRVETISLASDDQGIPCGFELYAYCKTMTTETSLDFNPTLPKGTVRCPHCFHDETIL